MPFRLFWVFMTDSFLELVYYGIATHETGSASYRVIYVGSEGHHPGPKQVNASAAIHRALQHFQRLDLTFYLTVAPALGDSVADRRKINVNIWAKRRMP